MCVLAVSILPLFTIFWLDLGTVQRVWFFPSFYCSIQTKQLLRVVWRRCTSELSDKYLSGIDVRQNFPKNTCLASMYVRTFRQILVWHRCTAELSDKYLSGIDVRQNFPTNTCRMLASMYVRTFRQILVVWSIPIAINKLHYSISSLSIKT